MDLNQDGSGGWKRMLLLLVLQGRFFLAFCIDGNCYMFLYWWYVFDCCIFDCSVLVLVLIVIFVVLVLIVVLDPQFVFYCI